MTRIELELSCDRTAGHSSPVLGSISVAGGPSSTFVGWVELLALLEEAALSPPTQKPPTTTETPDA